MRLPTSSLLLFFVLVAVSAGLHSRQENEVENFSIEIDDPSKLSGALSTNYGIKKLLRNDVVSSVCRSIYAAMSTFIPADLLTFIALVLLLPPAFFGQLIAMVIPTFPANLVSIIYDCLTERVVVPSLFSPHELFGEDPTTAIARFEGKIQGDVYYAQILPTEGSPGSVSVVAIFENLTPGSYIYTVHKSGDVSENCVHVAEKLSWVESYSFIADADGKAALMLQQSGLKLTDMMGRAVVVRPVSSGPVSSAPAISGPVSSGSVGPSSGTQSSCAVIARNIANLRYR